MIKLTVLSSGAYLTLISSAIAAEEYMHGETAHKLEQNIKSVEHASKGGLPQFDPTWFASQIFWLFVSFGVLYLIFAKKTLPDISSVIENRKNHIQSDLETAEKLTAEADKVHDSYQKSLTEAQGNAVEAIKKVENKSKKAAEKAMDLFRDRSDEATKETEKQIEIAKLKAMDDMNQIAVDAAAQAVEKIIGAIPDKAKVQAVIDNMNGKARAA